MKGMMMIFFVAVFLLLVLAWLVQETDPRRQYGSKAYHLLLAGMKRLNGVVSQAKQYLYLRKIEGVASYQGTFADDHREQTGSQFTFGQENLVSADYKKREKYNRKVLD